MLGKVKNMSKGFTSIAILLGIAFVILIGGAVVYQKVLAPKANPTPILTVSLTPTLTPTITTIPSSISQASPTPDPMTEWKTYTDTQYSFSLKYPDGFSVTDKTKELQDLYQKDQVPRHLLLSKVFVKDNIRVDISVYANGRMRTKDSTDIVGWLEGGSWNISKSYDSVALTQLPETIVAGRTAIRGYEIGLTGTSLVVIVPGPKIIQETTSFMYVIDLDRQSGCYGYTEKDVKDQKICTLFDQILSTFKFLD